ncbi:MAG: kinase [Gammaproteobacteria bacterium]|nr:kinase [Gammaproteobacteria bacterium]MBU2056993.1 kinase [Gammaproteobacteria bacterium]MBU2174475.1 kinase [Gammaproteobacteria bacterium]MBU2248167.1 kinase [Gammaproteobacteria bacterium]MBU2346449.1 kinase [Gammaproteobacteria bacterium]
MTENVSNLWLKQWLFYSLKAQMVSQILTNEQLSRLSQQQPSTPFIIGISGAQGSGKSSLAAALQQLWSGFGVQADVVSLDDYYLEPAHRLKRARLWHPLFAERGVPGTHDTELLLSQLQGFKRAEPQHWRRYNKGQDKVATATSATKAKLLILEGWCIGLKPQPDSELHHCINKLEQQQDPEALWRYQVNQQLAGDYQLVWQQLEQLIWLNAPDWQAVCRWRAWQEQPLQQLGRGKSPAQLDAFMLYFQRLTQESWQQLPQCADFILELDQEHNLISLTPDEQVVDG